MMQRRAISVDGIVQGVGFRPFVHALASRLDLRGFVKNQTGNVSIEVEGERASLETFLDELRSNSPPLAHIDQVFWSEVAARGDRQFRIETSEIDPEGRVLISPDVATCGDCLNELFDPANRRYGYPFLNCTHCGPRLTIITGSPYDRARTTMEAFSLCPACRQEYENPADRRFHAQPTCCETCGPALRLLDGDAALISATEPLELFAQDIRSGRIGAMKGLGGYHLICDATNESVVAEMRRRKHRDERPFALMVRTIREAEMLCVFSPLERQLLESPRAPIVLLRKRAGARIAATVAPGNPFLGVMLPYTPLHHLLLRGMEGTPLVMTSGNRSDEPIAYEDADAIARLRGIADVFLVHNRPIHVRCDDSVTRVVAGAELPIRRSRGYAPQSGAAADGVFPSDPGRRRATQGGVRPGTRTACVPQPSHGRPASILRRTRPSRRDIDHFEQLFGIRPQLIAHDMHPDYASTRYAKTRRNRERRA